MKGLGETGQRHARRATRSAFAAVDLENVSCGDEATVPLLKQDIDMQDTRWVVCVQGGVAQGRGIGREHRRNNIGAEYETTERTRENFDHGATAFQWKWFAGMPRDIAQTQRHLDRYEGAGFVRLPVWLIADVDPQTGRAVRPDPWEAEDDMDAVCSIAPTALPG